MSIFLSQQRAILWRISLPYLVLAALAGGCSDGSSSSGGGVGGSGGGTPVGCVPSENPDAVGDECGVFVASSGNDGSAGTKAEPVKTLAEAIALAAQNGTRVYACAETFEEAVEVPAGMTIFGGLDCANGWRWIGEMTKTTVAPAADAIPLKLMSGEGTTHVEDVAARAADAMTPGGSSIAVLADGATAELVRCELTAGNGADGEKGAPGAEPDGMGNIPPAAAGMVGNAGVNACTDLDMDMVFETELPGGVQVVNDCGGGELSIGGKGGDSSVQSGLTGQAGQIGIDGQGGAGEPAGNSDMWNCGAIPGDPNKGGGNAGANGTPGEPGPGATGLGTLTSSGYAGVPGSPGTAGKPGQGGGGGGGAKGGAICSGGANGAGASGGSGGAGGCGGQPGQGGGPGGASIALASFNATVTLTACTLSAGNGGRGGEGGDLQPGGSGGQGGVGGQGTGGSKNACAGGQGGQGGNGGPGGGGLGGPSLAIAFTGTPVTKDAATTLTPGTAGLGGPGGNGGMAGNTGGEGIAADQQEFP